MRQMNISYLFVKKTSNNLAVPKILFIFAIEFNHQNNKRHENGRLPTAQ